MRPIHFVACLYLAFAILFTSSCLFRTGVSFFLRSAILPSNFAWLLWRGSPRSTTTHSSHMELSLKTDYGHLRASLGATNLKPSKLGGGVSQIPLSGELLISKAFTYTVQPIKINPYLYRASQRIEKEDITITTLITSSRFKPFKRLVERYKGAFSQLISGRPDQIYPLRTYICGSSRPK
jgi:hypothetical protein